MNAELYTSSRLKVLKSCLRQHYYRYVLGIEQPSNAKAHFGTVAHIALEAWYRTWQDGGSREAMLGFALAVVGASDLHAYDKARLSALVTAYHLRWGSANWTILAVEVEFRYELGGFTIGGKIDALIRDNDTGLVWVVEHKSTGQDATPGGSYWAKLAIDAQVSIYIDGATILGYEIAGCIYDVLQRPRHEPKLATPVEQRKYTAGSGCPKCGGSGKAGAVKRGMGYTVVSFVTVEHVPCAACKETGWKLGEDGKPKEPHLYANQRDTDETIDDFSARVINEIAEAPDEFLIRGNVVRLDDELPRMRADIIDAIKLERASALFGLRPRNSDACSKFGTMCSYFALCTGTADEADEIRFPRGATHPELASAA